MVAFAGFGITYKITEHLNCDKPQTNFFIYFSAAVITLIWVAASGRFVPTPNIIAIGAGSGLISFLVIIIVRKAVSKGRVSMAWTIVNLSLIVPVIVSAFIWKEIPQAKDYAGIALTIIAIALLGVDIGRSGE